MRPIHRPIAGSEANTNATRHTQAMSAKDTPSTALTEKATSCPITIIRPLSELMVPRSTEGEVCARYIGMTEETRPTIRPTAMRNRSIIGRLTDNAQPTAPTRKTPAAVPSSRLKPNWPARGLPNTAPKAAPKVSAPETRPWPRESRPSWLGSAMKSKDPLMTAEL